MANKREYDLLFRLNAQLGNSYTSTFTKAQQQLVSIQKEIDALSKVQSDIAAYQKQQSAVDATQKKLEVLQQQYANIQRELSETEDFSSALENQLLSKQRQIDKTNDSLTTYEQKLAQMSAALRNAGVDTGDLSRETGALGAQVDALKQKQEAAAEKATGFGNNTVQAFSAVQQAIVAAGITTALSEMVQYLQECTDASMEFESAMAGVAKTTDFSDVEFSAMSAALKKMSTEIPATTTELSAVSEAAGQLGIAKQDLLSFTETMTMLGTATNLTAEDAASQLAKFANITKMSASNYDELGAVIVDLGNNFATTEADIVAMGRNLAAAGELVGLSEANIMALAATMSSLGVEAQMGGTAISKLMREFEIMIATGSESLEDFAEVSGMSNERFVEEWGANSVGAIAAFIRGLGDMEASGGSAIATLDELGITESRMVDSITRLASSGDLLVSAIDLANTAWDENTALMTEAEKRYATTQSKLIMLQNSYNNLQVAIGDAYTPALREAYSAGADMLDGIAEFVERNPELVRAVTAAGGALLATTAAITGVTAATKAFFALKAAGAFAAFTGPVWAGIAAVTVLAAGIAALASVTDEEAAEVRGLTETSRDQYEELQRLNAEYQQGIELHSEETKELQSLRFEIDNLTADYERSKQSIADYSKQVQESIAANKELIESHKASIDEIDREEYNVSVLITRLSALANQNDQTSASQEKIRATVDALNRSLPGLNLNYKDITTNGTSALDAIKAMAQAGASQKRFEQNRSDYDASLALNIDLEKNATDTLEQKKSAQERYNKASEKYMEARMMYSRYSTAMYSEEYKEFKAAEEALSTYTESHAGATAELQANQAEQERLLEAMEEYAGVTGTASEGNMALQKTLDDVKLGMDDLAETYTTAYEAALASVQGQFSLWEKAPEVVAMSVSEMNAYMEGQTAYLQDYNANLASLRERAADIEGLSRMIASYADGSPESANAIAGLAAASDEQLAQSVSLWLERDKEQRLLSETLALNQTEFEKAMGELQTELETTITEMNLGAEAAESGKNTVQGFINGAEGMLPAVKAEYERIAQTAMQAIDAKLDIHSPSREMEWRAEMTWAGYINKTRELEPDVAAVMAEAANTGTNAFSAEEAQMVMFAPQFMAALSAMSAGTDAVAAEHYGVGFGGITFDVNIHIDADTAGDSGTLSEALQQAGDEFVDIVMERLEERGIDIARRRIG